MTQQHATLLLYRNLLKQSRLFFDDIGRDFLWSRIRSTFRKNASLDTASTRCTRKLAQGRRTLSRITRATTFPFDAKACTRILNAAYGRTGPRRHELLKDYLIAPAVQEIEWPHRGKLPQPSKPLVSLIKHTDRQYEVPMERLSAIPRDELKSPDSPAAKRLEKGILKLYKLTGKLGGDSAKVDAAKLTRGLAPSVEKNLRWRVQSRWIKRIQVPLSPGGDSWANGSLIDQVEAKAGKVSVERVTTTTTSQAKGRRPVVPSDRFIRRRFRELLKDVPIVVTNDANTASVPQMGQEMKFRDSEWTTTPTPSTNHVDRQGLSEEALKSLCKKVK